MFTQLLIWAINQGNYQNFDPSLLLKYVTLTNFHENIYLKKIGDSIQCFAPLWISCFNQYARYFTHNGVTRILAKDFDRPGGIFSKQVGGANPNN